MVGFAGMTTVVVCCIFDWLVEAAAAAVGKDADDSAVVCERELSCKFALPARILAFNGASPIAIVGAEMREREGSNPHPLLLSPLQAFFLA